MVDSVTDMATWEESLINGVVDAFCQSQRAANAINDFWARVAPNPISEAFSNLGNATYRRVCNAAPPQPEVDVPVGQCVGNEYSVNHVYEFSADEGATWTEDTFIRNCPSGLFGAITNVSPRTIGGSRGIYADFGTGTPFPAVNQAVTNFTTSNPLFRFRIVSFNVSRCDGEPDDCGEATPAPTPPDYNIINNDITYINDLGIEVTIPTTFQFNEPFIEVNGEVHIPVRINYNDLDLNVPIRIDADFNVSTGDIKFEFGGSQGGDNRGDKCAPKPTDYEPVDPVPPPNPDSDSDDEEKPDDPTQETIIRGVVVSVSSVPQGPTIIFGGPAAPDAYVPDLGLIWFKCRVGRSSTAWQGGIRVQALRQLIVCEWPGGAIDWGWSPRPGVVATITPIRALADRVEQNPSATP